MSFKTDNGGLALALADVKLISSCSTWSTRLSQIGRVKGEVIICTYSLPSIEYIKRILDKNPHNTILIAHEKFACKAHSLHAIYPNLQIFLKNNVHAKMVLIEPKTVWLGSANFGQSGWFECCIWIHDEKAYDYYRDEIRAYIGI